MNTVPSVVSHPNPHVVHPIEGCKALVFLKNIIKNPHIQVGEYTYYHDGEDGYNFEKNVRYHFDFVGDKLIIGKFCALASGVKFIMNGGNHALDGVSTYPFKIMGGSWGKAPLRSVCKGDTLVGNDVWIGHDATIMPGIRIGDGAVIGAKAVVTRDVAPYTIVGGNPAVEIRRRFDAETTEILLQIQWWHWDAEKITRHLDLIINGNALGLKNYVS